MLWDYVRGSQIGSRTAIADEVQFASADASAGSHANTVSRYRRACAGACVIPVVTRFFWPPLMPRIMSFPTGVS